MNVRALSALLMILAVAAGCQNQPKPAEQESMTPAVDTARVAEVRQMYQQVNANTRVGYINAVLADDQLVSVVDVPTADFKIGDTVTFVDVDQNPIASGRVVNVLPDAVHVRYAATERAPRVGDLAVKFVRS